MYKLSAFTYTFNTSGKPRKIFLETPLELNRNETIVITGASGGGKSTFLKILKGIIPEYSSGKLEGEITFNGLPLTGVHFQDNLKKILYLFQNPFSQLIYPTTEEEFLFSMENFNFSHEEMILQKEKLEKLFDLKNVWNKKTTQLSNGECQKLVLASLLAIGPEVLLLDEPTAFLDPISRKEFYHFIEKVKGDRLLIIVDHHIDEIRPLVDRMIEVDQDGRIFERDKNIERVRNPQTIKLPDFMSPETLSLSLKEVTFSYDNKSTLLQNITASFKGAEVVAIKGANGVGKSTLFKLLAGIISPLKGDIVATVGEKKFKNQKNFSNVGYIFQNPETHFFYDTIEEELKQSFKHLESAELSQELLNRFFHDVDLKKSPFLLSEGEKRRLSILMTVFLGKTILLFDEPTFGQDQNSIEQIIALIKELKRQKLIQIIISHDDAFIAEVCDRVFILESGSLNEIS